MPSTPLDSLPSADVYPNPQESDLSENQPVVLHYRKMQITKT